MFAILKARDSFICIFLMISSLARHIIKGFASEGWMFYVGELLFAHMGRLVDNPVKPLPENSHLLNITFPADILLVLLRFSCFAYAELVT